MVSVKALSIIRDVIAERRFPIHMFVVFPRINTSEISKLEDRARYKGSYLSVTSSGDDVFKFFVKLKKRQAEGYIITYKSFWIFLTYEQKADTRSVTSILLRKLYPLIYYQYIHVADFLGIIEHLSRVYKITVKEYLVRSKIAQREKGGRKFTKVTKSWTEQRFSHDIFSKIMEKEKGIIDALRLAISSYEFFADLRLYRNGSLTLYKGEPNIYPDIYTFIIEPYVKLALGSIEKLSKVKRVFIKDKLDSEVHPLTLIFEDYRLTKDDYELVLNSLSKQFFISVYYLGNPIFHALLTDREEGSSFEIVAYGNKVEIVPDFRASAESLQIVLDVFSSINPHSKYVVM